MNIQKSKSVFFPWIELLWYETVTPCVFPYTSRTSHALHMGLIIIISHPYFFFCLHPSFTHQYFSFPFLNITATSGHKSLFSWTRNATLQPYVDLNFRTATPIHVMIMALQHCSPEKQECHSTSLHCSTHTTCLSASKIQECHCRMYNTRSTGGYALLLLAPPEGFEDNGHSPPII